MEIYWKPILNPDFSPETSHHSVRGMVFLSGVYYDRIKYMLKHSLKTGFSFGLTSGIITTLGLIVGLHSGTHSKAVVIGGILIIAIADAFSDALGIHVSEESEALHTKKEIWESTLSTFLTKFIFALTFVIPVLLLKLSTAILVSVIWGMFLLSILSFYLAKDQKIKPWSAIGEHLIIALIVITLTHYLGDWLSLIFASK